MAFWRHIIFLGVLIVHVVSDDFYEKLGINKNADDREIRRAFKKKALLLHPDKNPDDPKAQEKFIELNRAYEVLKDQDLRKKYDLYGEEGLDDSKNRGHQYHSWNYYHESFGIYDEDPEIITLNNADFEQSISGTEDVWFVNFYHPRCSHCHTLAPIWREVARELNGVVRIGAVNCDDEFQLCHSQGIRSYPSLFSYPGRNHYTREKSKEQLISYILKEVSASLISLPLSPTVFLSQNNKRTETHNSKWWLIISYQNQEDAEIFRPKVVMLAAILDGLVNIGPLHCFSHGDKQTCSKLGLKKQEIRLYTREDLKGKSSNFIEINSLDAQEISSEVLKTLPDLPLLSTSRYNDIRSSLENYKEAKSWLIQFTANNDDDSLEMRKLTGLTEDISMGRISCDEMRNECNDLYITKTPAFILFKPGGGYEIHQGRMLARDVIRFAKDGSTATQFQILTPKKFPKVLAEGKMWFVDFYAPWCPPCMRLLPEFRKASRFIPNVNFGTIDCTTHSELCSNYNIRSYPTTILYNDSTIHQYRGQHTASSLVDFIKDILNPSVVNLDDQTFDDLVVGKADHILWVVDFFANWCGPCQQMASEYSKFGRLVSNLPNVRVGKVDCANYRHVCTNAGINSYPTIKIYKEGRFSHTNTIQYRSNWPRDSGSFKQWLYTNMPSKVKEIDYTAFRKLLGDEKPWLIDFYSPNCGYCHQFAPEFEDIANELGDRVNTGKVNCIREDWICSQAQIDAYPTVKLYVGRAQGEEKQNYIGTELNSLDKEYILSEVFELLEEAENSFIEQRTKDEL